MSPERNMRIRQLLALRQPSLTLCLEQLDKPHNVSAIVRSCDAVGVHEVQAIWKKKAQIRKGTAMGSENWVYTREHSSIENAVRYLKQQKMQVLVTNLSDKAVDFREVDYSLPTAIILGQEKHGATDEAIALADQEIVIPMVGMVQSLNVSVAAALILYEAQRQRQIAGMYNQPQLSAEECQKVLFQGGFPRYREICDRKGIEYPYVDEHGHIQADDALMAKNTTTECKPFSRHEYSRLKGLWS
ncbi:tRNA (guanosine(18)-2'-O)-methyltransferase TrmH [Paraglaciecola aquimarina]|uniref:tRNA (guanosine(18)-2'-O)-methyltransferase n=1 Tax=Paraglaciecola aquimarina TaxID=1235557 RepID=A0ABU3SSC5_9ALTE|nr:tRNA (guanosine(18)-2'-O)-methyltransferase TrmH [Paraglaciecola aquimarina]MDU0352924.1 tRNA (guanosine(18)-2'-O)-methyltransferase TrmH [Paraglaciecola aquimarina]